MSKPKHILVIRLSAMGDVAMTVPVLRAFTRQYPDVKLTVLTRDFFKPLFRDLKNVTVYPAHVKDQHKGLKGLYKLSREIRPLKCDAVADLHKVLRSKVLKPMLGIRKVATINKGRKEKKRLIKGKDFKQLKTTHQRYADVFNTLGYPIDLSNPTFPKPTTLNDSCLKLIGKPNKKRIGIAPFAAHDSKMYPLEHMERVIEKLSEDYQVLLFGGGSREIQILNYFESEDKGIINLAGKLSLDEELDVISNLHVMLSMDSGNAHLAAMFGIKVITIWGVTHPYAGFAPFKQPDDYCLLADRNQYLKIPTSIYGNKFPEGYKDAAGSISVETIVNKVKSVIPA
ncbi:glycosyltransferase family 9 protein [Hanstruepera ponticola]|uniref:glycosyltransferase family 9 protein n=1 Tax=Hanstruepera ponticola TaxID=2042995 RepID=UPI001F439C54|nr:glycosyltransferase family 9 protein [Hanstruepera ponticola]